MDTDSEPEVPPSHETQGAEHRYIQPDMLRNSPAPIDSPSEVQKGPDDAEPDIDANRSHLEGVTTRSGPSPRPLVNENSAEARDPTFKTEEIQTKNTGCSELGPVVSEGITNEMSTMFEDDESDSELSSPSELPPNEDDVDRLLDRLPREAILQYLTKKQPKQPEEPLPEPALEILPTDGLVNRVSAGTVLVAPVTKKIAGTAKKTPAEDIPLSDELFGDESAKDESAEGESLKDGSVKDEPPKDESAKDSVETSHSCEKCARQFKRRCELKFVYLPNIYRI
jgi:hypothetical protein